MSRGPSDPELLLLSQIRDAGLPEPVSEHVFAKPRRWRYDFAWPDRMVACEVEGGTWVSGRHNRGKGYEGDCVKYSEAAIRGWRVIRCTSQMVEKGEAIALLRRVLESPPHLVQERPQHSNEQAQDQECPNGPTDQT